MRAARLTEQGIMVNPEALRGHPVDAAISMFVSLLDKKTKYYSVRYKGKRAIHLVIDPPNGEMRVQCGLPTEGKATIWNFKDKKVTCKKCINHRHSKETGR